MLRATHLNLLRNAWEHVTDEAHAVHTAKGFSRKEPWTAEAQIAQIALMHEELSEAVHGIRKDLMDDKLPQRRMLEVELADVVIRIMNFARENNLDIPGAIVEKIQFNAGRPFKHGDKAL